MSNALAGRRIVVPETRELDLLADMLERHGATALRCPLVAIRDVDDAAPVEAWLKRFIAEPPGELDRGLGGGCRGRIVVRHRRDGGIDASEHILIPRRRIGRGDERLERRLAHVLKRGAGIGARRPRR